MGHDFVDRRYEQFVLFNSEAFFYKPVGPSSRASVYYGFYPKSKVIDTENCTE